MVVEEKKMAFVVELVMASRLQNWPNWLWLQSGVIGRIGCGCKVAKLAVARRQNLQCTLFEGEGARVRDI